MSVRERVCDRVRVYILLCMNVAVWLQVLCEHSKRECGNPTNMLPTFPTIHRSTHPRHPPPTLPQTQVLGSRQEVLLDSFLALLPDASVADFAQVLELRGLRKPEQQQLLEAYAQRTGRKASLRGSPGAPGGASASALGVVRSGGSQLGGLGVSFTSAGQAGELAARLRQGTQGATARASTGMRETMNAMRAMGLRLREASNSFRQT